MTMIHAQQNPPHKEIAMKTKAVRLYGKNDLRYEEFELRALRKGELLARVVTDSLCMSTHKAMLQGSDHRCVPGDIAERPVITGHEFCAVVEAVGTDVEGWAAGDIFTVQPKMYIDGALCGPGYSFPEYGGDATHIIVPKEALEGGYLLPFRADAHYKASLAEPISCLASALDAHWHLASDEKTHQMGLKPGGSLAILAGCGPMGLGAVQVAMAMPEPPARIVVTDIDEARRARAGRLFPGNGTTRTKLAFVNTKSMPEAELAGYAGGVGFDDILVMAPVPAVLETADRIAGEDCCINFFAGPTSKSFYAPVNFYDVHYRQKHIIGTSGGAVSDMRKALRLIESGTVDPSLMITHIGGLDSAASATMHLPEIPGGKKLIYCGIEMELTAIEDFKEKGERSPLFRDLYEICAQNDMLWCPQAERYLLSHA